MDVTIKRDATGRRWVDHPMNGKFAHRLQKRIPKGHKIALVNIFSDVASDGDFFTYNMEIRLANQNRATFHKASSYVKILSVPTFKQTAGEGDEE